MRAPYHFTVDAYARHEYNGSVTRGAYG
jgi:hypothetical protein